MGVRPEYFMATSVDSPFYGAPRRVDEMLGAGERLQTEELPAGWLRQAFGVWEGWTPRDWRPRLQGWKIHVSASMACAVETLARTTRLCVERDVAFKFLPDEGKLADTNGKQADRGASGKFITIYPDDDAQFAELLEALEEALAGQDGPSVLSDLRYRDAPVYVRHGGIMALNMPDGNDRPIVRRHRDRVGAVRFVAGQGPLHLCRPALRRLAAPAGRGCGAGGDHPSPPDGAVGVRLGVGGGLRPVPGRHERDLLPGHRAHPGRHGRDAGVPRPLGVSVALSRRARDLLWVGLAAAGVALLGFSPGDLDPVGVAWSLCAAALWAGYILLAGPTGRRWSGVSGVAVAFWVGLIGLTPLVLALGLLPAPVPVVWGLGLTIGLLSSAIPYGLEMMALRRIEPRISASSCRWNPPPRPCSRSRCWGRRCAPSRCSPV